MASWKLFRTAVGRFLYTLFPDLFPEQRRLDELTQHLHEQERLTTILMQIRTDLEKEVELLRQLSTHDELTKLLNRRGLEEVFEHEMTHVDRDQHPGATRDSGWGSISTQVAAIFIDLDRFKDVNDRFGHAAGDKVLIIAAELLRKSVRLGDTVARLGGDELVVILYNASLQDAAKKAETFQERLRQDERLTFADIQVTASIGIAEIPFGTPLESALKHADAAMYDAKREGRNRIVLLKR